MSREQISKALKRLRENTGLTADEVGALVGKSGKTVNAWENNRGQPDAEMLIKLCDVYKVNNILEEFKGSKINIANQFLDSDRHLLLKYHLLDKHGTNIVDYILNKEYERCTEIEKEPQQNYIDLKIASLPASAGTGVDLQEENYEIMTVKCTELTEQADFAVRVSGNSMEPTYSDGDILLVEGTPFINIGDIGIFVVNGDGYVKEYGGNCLISHNEKYSDIKLSEYDVVICSGKVIGVLEE